MAKPRITITLDPKDYEHLSYVAKEEERSLSWLVAHAVKDYLGSHKLLQQQQLPLDKPK